MDDAQGFGLCTQLGEPEEVPGFQETGPSLDVAAIWEMNQQVDDLLFVFPSLSVTLPLELILKKKKTCLMLSVITLVTIVNGGITMTYFYIPRKKKYYLVICFK